MANEELLEFKRQQLQALRQEREAAAVSVLSNERTKILEELPTAADTWTAQQCPLCLGMGKVAGLFSKYDCGACHGSGFVLDDPIKLIHHLLDGGRKLRAMYRAKERELADFKALWTEKEITERQGHRLGEQINSRFD